MTGPTIATGPGATAFVKPQRTGASMFWKGVPREVQVLLNDKPWQRFHEECGRHGLFFTDVEPVGRTGYQATAYRVARRGSGYERFQVADGRGAGPQDACQDAVRKAAAAGFPVPAEVADLLDRGLDIDALLGGPAADFMELIG